MSAVNNAEAIKNENKGKQNNLLDTHQQTLAFPSRIVQSFGCWLDDSRMSHCKQHVNCPIIMVDVVRVEVDRVGWWR